MKNKLSTVALLGGMGIVVVGFAYHVRVIGGLTIVGLGVATAVWGIYVMVTRRAKIPMSDDANTTYEVHTGVAAFLYGTIALVFSVPLMAFGVEYLIFGNQPPKDLYDRLLPGPDIQAALALLVGVLFIVAGLTRVAPGTDKTQRRGLDRWSTAISLFTVGGTLVFVTIMRTLFPGTLTRVGMSALTFLAERAK